MKKHESTTWLDRILFRLIDRYAYQILIFALLVLTLWIRITMVPNCVLSADYQDYYLPWTQTYRSLGLAGGLRQGIGDYYIPYAFLFAFAAMLPCEPYLPIAVVHIAAEYVGAFFIYKIVRLVLDERDTSRTEHNQRIAMAIGVALLYLPPVILNAALWKQFDSLYTCFIIISLYLMMKERYTAAFIVYAIGFCFKLQAIFFLPFLLILYLSKRDFSLFQFFWIPFLYLLTGLPAVLCGRRWQDVYKTYLGNTGEYDGMSINSTNFYQLGLNDYPALYRAAILATVAIFAFAALYVIRKRKGLTLTNQFALAAWCVWTAFLFLPGMHERYDYPAIVLVCALTWTLHRRIWIGLVMVIASVVTYSGAILRGTDISLSYMTIACVAAYVVLTLDLVKSLSEANAASIASEQPASLS